MSCSCCLDLRRSSVKQLQSAVARMVAARGELYMRLSSPNAAEFSYDETFWVSEEEKGEARRRKAAAG